MTLKVFLAFVLFSLIFVVGISQSEIALAQSQNRLSISFENDVAPSYDVSLNPNER